MEGFDDVRTGLEARIQLLTENFVREAQIRAALPPQTEAQRALESISILMETEAAAVQQPDDSDGGATAAPAHATAKDSRSRPA